MIAPYTDGPISAQYFEAFLGSTPPSKIRKSANKRNNIHMSCESLSGTCNQELRDRVIDLVSIYFDSNGNLIEKELPKDIIACVSNNIPGLDPHESACFLVDGTKGNGIPDETRMHFAEGFKNGVRRGPLIGAPIAGGWFVIDRVDLAPAFERRGSLNIALRGANQMERPIEDLVHGLLLNSNPSILEPISYLDVSISNSFYSEFKNYLRSRRGFIESEESTGNIVNMTGSIPFAEYKDIKELLKKSAPTASVTSAGDLHYNNIPGSICIFDSALHEFLEKFRKNNLITTNLDVDNYFDTI